MPGVNIVIKGTSNGTQSDFDGNYSIEIPFGQELQYNYIGQRNVSIPIYSSIMNIRMEEDVEALEEVVVMGHGNSNPNDFTSAVSSISPEQHLQGRAVGVQIRGISSVRAPRVKDNEPKPLYIIDGVPIEGFQEGE